MDYLTPEQVGEKLQFRVRTIYKLIRTGQLPASKIGQKYRISEEQLERFMKAQEVNNDPERDDS